MSSAEPCSAPLIHVGSEVPQSCSKLLCRSGLMIKCQIWGQSGHEVMSALLCRWCPGRSEQQGRLEDNVSLETGQESTIHPSQNGRKFLGLRCCKRVVAILSNRLCNRS